MTSRLRWQLSTMMFLQYAIFGAWMPILALHLNRLGISGLQIGYIYGTLALASIISPFIAGQIADRYFATQRFLAASHLLGSVLLYVIATRTTFLGIYVTMFLYALIYVPTPALGNALAFHHLPDAQKNFGPIRAWGTAGWVFAGWLFGAWLGLLDPVLRALSPAAAHALASWRGPQANVGQSLVLASSISALLGLYCLTLPHTPPRRAARNPWAFLAALSLLRQRNFGVLVGVSFFMATQTGFHYQLTPIFFREALSIPAAWVAPLLTIGQIGEVAMLALLPLAIKRLGMRTTIALGIAAWPLRYLIFALGKPTALAVAAQSLHGLAFAFFVVASQLYANEVAQGDIRASAQNLLVFVYGGVGAFLGNLFAGWSDVLLHRDFHTLFLLPVAITTACCLAFLLGFSERTRIAHLSAASEPTPSS